MSIEVTAAPAGPRLRDLVARGATWALLACCLVVGVTIVVAGERETPAGTLQSAIDDGSVTEIEVYGSLRNGDVHWQDGRLHRVTDLHDAPRLRLGDDVEVTSLDSPGVTGQIGAWRVPAWAGLLRLVVCISALCLLAVGPEPLLATRGGWFWLLVLVPWVAVPGLLLLGGSAGLPSPRRGRRRLIWAQGILLGLVLALATSVLTANVL